MNDIDIPALIERLNGWNTAIDITVGNQDRFEWVELRSLQPAIKDATTALDQLRWRRVDTDPPSSLSKRKIVCMHVRDGYMYTYTCTEQAFYGTGDHWSHWLPLPTPPQESSQ